jgi:galactose mutarotase-like enzyme
MFEEHGEVALLPWTWQITEDEPEQVSVLLTVRCRQVPLIVEKRLMLRDEEAALFIEETLTNVGGVSIDLMWGHHPAFGAPFIDEHCRIDVPAQAAVAHPVERFPSQRLAPAQAFRWAQTQGREGQAVDFSRPQPRGAGRADLLYLTDLREGWFTIANPRLNVRVGMAWTLETFPYLWYWHDANGTPGYPWYSESYVLALEPWSSTPSMGLAEAVKRGTHLTLAPGEQRQTRLTTVVEPSGEQVRGVDLEGVMYSA